MRCWIPSNFEDIKKASSKFQEARWYCSTKEEDRAAHNNKTIPILLTIMNIFNILLLTVAAVVTTSATGLEAPQAHQLDESYTFEDYLSHFNKSYNDLDEYMRRKELFNVNMQTILNHNKGRLNDQGDILDGGYVMGVNLFTDVDHSELPLGYNKLQHPAWSSQLVGAGVSKTERKLGGIDTQSYSKPSDFQQDEVSDLPPTVDWDENKKVRLAPQQGSCGSCWTFAATAAVESHTVIATGEDIDALSPLSEQNMLECTPNKDDCGGTGGCKGATVELGLNYIADKTAKGEGGMYTIEDLAYSTDSESWTTCDTLTKDKSPSVGIKGWTQLKSNDYKATMNAIAKVGPVALAVAASKWGLYEKGVFDPTDGTGGASAHPESSGGDATINHAVLLVGYGVDETTGQKYYKIRNSWGTSFGENGYIRILRTDDDDNNCQIDNEPLVGIACALDENGNKLDVKPTKVCGACGVLFDVSYPVGAHKIAK